MLFPRYAVCLAFVCAAPLCLGGCHSHPVSAEQARATAQVHAAEQRQQLDQLPPPSKNRYMAVRSYDSWQNPYITIQPDMITVHVLLADANPAAYGSGGMLRPINARRQEVNISLLRLGEAMTAIPESSWPYGRVVAIDEAHVAHGEEEHQLRRNTEAAVAILSDIGILAYDMKEGNLR